MSIDDSQLPVGEQDTVATPGGASRGAATPAEAGGGEVQAELAELVDAIGQARSIATPQRQAPTIGRYRVLDKLGEGGMGTVYAVYDEQLDRRVALKVVRGLQSDTARQRMLREAQAMAKLSHPNVVPVFEVGEHDGKLFVAMEYVRGATLREWLDDGERTLPEILSMYLQAGRGLEAAHAEGLVHRDFKPHNAMVGEDDRVRVLDFGLAARPGEEGTQDPEVAFEDATSRSALDETLTEAGTMMGTPAYMSPEQLRAAEVDHRSDQFSFCVALWEAAFGAPPFRRGSLAELAIRIQDGDIETPERSDAPAALQAALRRGLAGDRDARWPDMTSLLAELQALVAPHRTKSRAPSVVGGLAVLGVAAAFGAPRYEAYRRAQGVTSCRERADADLAEFWGAERRAEALDGLRATGVEYAETTAEHTAVWLDAYANQWTAAAADTCVDVELDAAWDPDLGERSRWCLDERLRSLDALASAFSQADGSVAENAVTAASDLPGVASCRDELLLRRQPAPPSGDDRDRLEKLQASLAEASALQAVGQHDRALTIAQDLATEAETIDSPSMRYRSQHLLGVSLGNGGKSAEAEQAMTSAYFGAAEADDQAAAARSATALVEVIGPARDRPDDVAHWARLADVALTLAGAADDHVLRASLLFDHAQAVLISGQDLDGARTRLERALSLLQDQLGASHPRVGTVLSRLSLIALTGGDFPAARDLAERALADHEAALGADHPRLVRSLSPLALVHRNLGEHAKALELFERALALQIAGLGPDHPEVGQGYHMVALAHGSLGDHARSAELLERALKIQRTALGPNHTVVAFAELGLGQALLRLARHEQARQVTEKAVASIEKAMGADHPTLAEGLNTLARVALATDDPDAAEPFVQRSLSLTAKGLGTDNPVYAEGLSLLVAVHQAHGAVGPQLESATEVVRIYAAALPADHPALASARFDLAKASVANGDDARGAELAKEALPALRDGDATKAGEVEAWLKKHAATPG